MKLQNHGPQPFLKWIAPESSAKTQEPAGIYLFKVVDNRNTRTKYEICSKLTIKTSVHHFEHISHLVLVFLLLILNL